MLLTLLDLCLLNRVLSLIHQARYCCFMVPVLTVSRLSNLTQSVFAVQQHSGTISLHLPAPTTRSLRVSEAAVTSS